MVLALFGHDTTAWGHKPVWMGSDVRARGAERREPRRRARMTSVFYSVQCTIC